MYNKVIFISSNILKSEIMNFDIDILQIKQTNFYSMYVLTHPFIKNSFSWRIIFIYKLFTNHIYLIVATFILITGHPSQQIVLIPELGTTYSSEII